MAKCRSCNADITFTPTSKGKLMPVDADGTSHFATCSSRLRTRPPEPAMNLCASCGSDNVERLPGTGPHHGAIRCHDCGSHRWLRKPQEAQT